MTDQNIKVGRMPPLEPIKIETVGKPNKLLIAFFSKRHYLFTEDWPVRLPSGEIVLIPQGTKTDGASFPSWLTALLCAIAIYFIDNPYLLAIGLLVISQLMRVVFNPMGLSLVPGVVHDFLYQNHYLPLSDGTRIYEGCTLWQADDLFKRIHFHVNDMPIFGLITHTGLRCGSFITWFMYRKKIDLSKASVD